VVSLLALIWGGQYLGNGSTVLAIVGLTSTAALVITVVRTPDPPEQPGNTPDPSRTAWQYGRTMMLFAAVLVVCGLQLAGALGMNAATADTGRVKDQAMLVIIMFLMGVTRAWEVVGATKPRFFGALAHELGPADPAIDAEKLIPGAERTPELDAQPGAATARNAARTTGQAADNGSMTSK